MSEERTSTEGTGRQDNPPGAGKLGFNNTRNSTVYVSTEVRPTSGLPVSTPVVSAPGNRRKKLGLPSTLPPEKPINRVTVTIEDAVSEGNPLGTLVVYLAPAVPNNLLTAEIVLGDAGGLRGGGDGEVDGALLVYSDDGTDVELLGATASFVE